MKIQIVSDIHLEFYDTYKKSPAKYIQPNAPIIALLGDIGYPSSSLYKNLIKELSEKFEHVIVITGNHEYYTTKRKKDTVAKINNKIKKISAGYNNVYFLNKQSVIINGYKFLGATLWADISEEEKQDAEYYYNDYSRIFTTGPRNITAKDTKRWHKTTVDWLKQELQENVPTVVLTHHAPSSRKIVHSPEYRDEPLRSVDATDLEHIMSDNLLFWGYGHTHYPADFLAMNSKTRIASNPFCYPDETNKEKLSKAGSKYFII